MVSLIFTLFKTKQTFIHIIDFLNVLTTDDNKILKKYLWDNFKSFFGIVPGQW